jgi:hypothetical protein
MSYAGRLSFLLTPATTLEDKIGELFGPRAAKAIAKLEDVGTDEEGGKELDRYVEVKLEPDEATQIQPFVDALVHALKEDAVAKATVHARVGLDVEAGGNALIRDIQGAREIVAKVKAGQDVTIEGFRLDTGRDPAKQPARSPVRIARRFSNTDRTTAGIRIDAKAGRDAVIVNHHYGPDEPHKCPRFGGVARGVQVCSRMVDAARTPDGVSPKRRRNMRLK